METFRYSYILHFIFSLHFSKAWATLSLIHSTCEKGEKHFALFQPFSLKKHTVMLLVVLGVREQKLKTFILATIKVQRTICLSENMDLL